MEWIKGAIAVIIGAYVLFVFIKSLSETSPEFSSVGWYLFAAFVIGAAAYLKWGWQR